MEKKEKNAIFFVGMMASGKSTVGRLLAKALAWPFFDVDREIEARCGVPISYIFEKEGEEGFRQRETQMMRELTSKPRVVVAMGGGAPLREENHELLARGLVIQLATTAQEIMARTRSDTTRPLLQSEDPEARIRELLEKRSPIYDAVCDIKVSTSQSGPSSVVHQLLEMPQIKKVIEG